jgi:uncharacterized protein
MKSLFRCAVFVVAILPSLLQVAFAGAFEDGNAAYERGDYAAALGFWQKPADQGDGRAQQAIGLLYDLGYGVPQDFPTAITWYRRSAEGGNAVGQYRLAFMYDNGLGVLEIPALAVDWYRKAADQGLTAAESALTEIAWRARDAKEAIRWGERAYAHGDAEAASLICDLYIRANLDPLEQQQKDKWCGLRAKLEGDFWSDSETVETPLPQQELARVVDEMDRAADAFSSVGRVSFRLYASTLRRPKGVLALPQHGQYPALMRADGSARIGVRGLLSSHNFTADDIAPGIHIIPEKELPIVADGGFSVVHIAYDAVHKSVLPPRFGGQ